MQCGQLYTLHIDKKLNSNIQYWAVSWEMTQITNDIERHIIRKPFGNLSFLNVITTGSTNTTQEI